MQTPFLELRNQLQSIVSDGLRSQPPTKEIIVFCLTQINLLHSQYLSMIDFELMGGQGDPEDPIKFLTRLDRSFLDYFTFINVLNQFGRVLSKKYNVKIPLKSRLRFYRNKASEHWDEYTLYVHGGSFSKGVGKPLTPTISSTYNPEERKQIKKEIDLILNGFTISLDIQSPEISNIMNSAENAEKLYSCLEQIDLTLCAKAKNNQYVIPDDLVGLLFKFGFPSPIADIDNYAMELVSVLRKELNL